MKLLVIGAGIGQIPLIERAKAKGIHVTCVTVEGDYPGIPLADDVWYVDIYDRDKIVSLAREKGIDAVISDQNDLMMPTVSYVAEKLSLPGNTFAATRSYCNKNTYHDNCDKIGNPVPKHIAVKTADITTDDVPFPLPWVIKPSDTQSSIGVTKVSDEKSVKPALEMALGHSTEDAAIIEEFFVGHEIVCEGFIDDGKYYNLSFADRKYFDLKNEFVPCQTLFPSKVDRKILDKVIACEERMAAYVHPAFGIVHAEYLVNEQTGEIRVVESALRGGGVYISSHLIPLSTGIDINEVLLDKATGVPVDTKAVIESRNDKAAGYVCFHLPEGVIKGIHGLDEIKALPFVKMVALVGVEVGMKTERMINKKMRKGPILVTGENREDLEKNIKTVQEIFRIDVENDRGEISGIIWK